MTRKASAPPNTVTGLLTKFGRPMTTYEILLELGPLKNPRQVYNEITSGIRHRILRDFELDLRPFYAKKTRLIGLNVKGIKLQFVEGRK